MSASLVQDASVAQIVIAVVALVGILPALVGLVRQRGKERRDRLAEAYSVMGDRWSDFLELCLDHPDLGLAALGLRDDANLSLNPKKLFLYSAQIQLINRAYVLYRDEPEDVKRDRYSGWQGYLDGLLGLDEFLAAWKLVGFGYDESFVQYVNERIRQLESAAGDPDDPSASGGAAHDQPDGEAHVQQPVGDAPEGKGPWWSVTLSVVVAVAGGAVLLALFLGFIFTFAQSFDLDIMRLGAGLFLLLSLGFVVMAFRQSEHRDRWVAGAVLNAVLGVALTIGAGVAKDHLTPPKPDCAAFYSQLVEIVTHEQPGVAEAAAESDPRNSACHEPLELIKNGTSHVPPDIDGQPQKPRIDCLQFFVQLDELVDDEPTAIAESVIKDDPRKKRCRAPLELLAHR